MKIYSDYQVKYNKKKTIELISQYKNDIFSLFNKLFELIEVDPKMVSNVGEIFSKNRLINFDNFQNNSIVEIAPNTNDYLLRMISDLGLNPGEGFITYYPIYHRDFIPSFMNTYYEYIFCVQVKVLFAEATRQYLEQKITELINGLNKLDITINEGLALPNKIKFTSVDKLLKEFPFINKDDLIKTACQHFGLIFVYGVNGNNKKQIQFIEDKILSQGEITGTLYVYDNVNNETIPILTGSIAPTKKELENKILNYKLDPKSFEEMFSYLGDFPNQINIEFFFSKYMVYTLQKFCIHETLSSPNDIDVGSKNKILL